MPGFHRRPLALLICCAFAGIPAAHGAEEAQPEAVPAGAAAPEPAWLWPADGSVTAFALAQDDPPLNLKLQRKFDILAPKPAPVAPALPGQPAPVAGPKHKDTYPLFLIADRLEGRTDDVTVAEGHAEMRKVGTLLTADKITYWLLEDEVEALGDVRLQQRDDELSGPHLRMKVSEQVGFFDQADYKFKKEVTSRFYRPVVAVTTAVGTTATTGSAPLMISVPAGYGLPTTVPPRRPSEGYGHADRIEFEGENQVRMTNATYSTCRPDQFDWFLRGDEFKLDYDHEKGKASDATLVFKDVPIFYTPVASFSLNHQRQSGFLAGTFAASTVNGADITLPYYLNLAPNYDLTLYPREMSKRGFQLGAEAQYLNYNYKGVSRFEYVPNDQLENRARYAYNFQHAQTLGRGLSYTVNWNGVSDDRYWQDYSSRLLQTSQVQLPRQVAVGYSPGSWWSANMQVLRYQTLSVDPANPVSKPYFIEPQVNFAGRLTDVYRTDLTLQGQITKFTHPTLVEGDRAVFYPQLTMPYISPALSLMPKLGLHMTRYSLTGQAAGDPSDINRVLPIFSFDSTVFFERDTKWLGKDYIQTLEPRLYYVYIPYRNQDKIPVFDSGIADFNFAQIFTENRYTGYDRINDANQLTAAVTSRFLDNTTGAERFKAMVGQRYYFRQQQVTIPGENARRDNFSNFLGAFTGAVLPKTYVDAALEYNYHDNRTERYSIGARYQPDLAKVVSASYRFDRNLLAVGQAGQVGQVDRVDQVDFATQWPITSRWYGVGRYNYSVRDKRLLEGIAGVEYNAGCWATRFVAQHLEALAGAANTTFFFQLELKDFASLGSSPIQLLSRTIPGYGKINEMPVTGSLQSTQ